VTERPIIFSAPMVRAILDGRKTQTRRVAKVPDCTPGPLRHQAKHAGPYFDSYCGEPKTDKNPRGMSDRWCWWSADDRPDQLSEIRCPYGSPGDRLWVREAWAGEPVGDDARIFYRASCPNDEADIADGDAIARVRIGRWRPSIHMPRWASRIDLEITAVRVERLHAITEEDARAEGVDTSVVDPSPRGCPGGVLPKHYANARDCFADLWRTINGAASWDADPWVWAITFRRVRP
jgi:hypothetical protein